MNDQLEIVQKVWPDAVDIFAARGVFSSGMFVQRCRTPLWQTDRQALLERRIVHADDGDDSHRLVCGSPTSSADLFVCEYCAKQLKYKPKTTRVKPPSYR